MEMKMRMILRAGMGMGKHSPGHVLSCPVVIPIKCLLQPRSLTLADHEQGPNSPNNLLELYLKREEVGGLGNKSNIWCAEAGEVRGEVIEPEDASDASGVVVDGSATSFGENPYVESIGPCRESYPLCEIPPLRTCCSGLQPSDIFLKSLKNSTTI
ncbi:hypothetical protein TIFTF001_035967 [Ficus carica]|uniref:Uncharacterized protein n=1 Tax=Ficus carica TaxID=3494 RepID=A0AA88E6S8_FICCA|nr:hypothetical protein TIFTF001_035967 [Ficus carica]